MGQQHLNPLLTVTLRDTYIIISTVQERIKRQGRAKVTRPSPESLLFKRPGQGERDASVLMETGGGCPEKPPGQSPKEGDG